jgi:hypothetical protein
VKPNVLLRKNTVRRVRVDYICKKIMRYELRFLHVCSLPDAVVQLLSQSPHLHAQGKLHPNAKISFIPPILSPFDSRLSRELSLMLSVVAGSASFGNGVWTGAKTGMRCTAVTCSPRISGVAAMAGVDVIQPRAKKKKTESSGRTCAAVRRRPAGGGIGVATEGRRAT